MTVPKILLVKLSSLGDVIHTFAAACDLHRHQPQSKITWLVEEAYADLVRQHRAIDNVWTVPFRRIKKDPKNWRALQPLISTLRSNHFDYAIDAQGLIKSALIMRFARCPKRIGYDAQSAREAAAHFFYHQTISVTKKMHAVERTRQLFANAFEYSLTDQQLDYGLPTWQAQNNTLIFIHGTTWRSKLLPESCWRTLIAQAQNAGFQIRLPWGDKTEYERAQRLISGFPAAQCFPALSLPQLRQAIIHCAGVITVDTGLGHLAAACEAPTLGIFAATDAQKSGMYGIRSDNLALTNPCMQKDCRQHGAHDENACMHHWSAEIIWQRFLALKSKTSH
ncbi:lipopolysaccharide heptosyltransferase I [Dichelobacter nodosus]|uniref:Lipopolysaccharide heptosyltransferase 1 n=1 Tax=Dichelobacter nodosus (strain VCS1703A) TaxID=246195 RepID=A5EXW1_DICNV|nr:lipopolysaccharide heptosyltransferase I [Dichelobacter nodosus]ABQ13561.1 heptosyl transferase I [Dichelobacter nodosus VCS1703A]